MKQIFLFIITLAFIKDISAQTILNRGDIAILGVNVAVNKTTQDEITFVCFKNITSGTEIQLTDNGYANCSDSTWTSAEGGVKMKRVGGTIPAGTVLTLRTGNTSGDIVKFTYPDSSWAMSDLATGVTAAKFNLEATGDNFFIAQDGVWSSDPIYGCTVTGGGIKAIATFPGNNGRIITGFNSTQWQSLQSTLGASGAYPELDCFSIAPSTGKYLFYKYNGLLTAANQKDWLVRINNPANWKSYTTSALYYAATPKIDSTSLPILTGGDIPDPSWIPPSAAICSGGGEIDLSTFIIGTKGGTWSGNQVVNGKFNPAGLSGKYAITYSLPFSSSKGSCPLTKTDSILVNSVITPTVNAAIISPDQYLQSGKVDYKFYCTGTKVTFSANATETGLTPTYQWYRNDTIISGATSKTYTDSIVTSATYQCKVTSNSACAAGVTVINPRLIIGLDKLPSVSFSSVGSNCSGFDTLKLRGVSGIESVIWKNGNDVVKQVNYSLIPVSGNKTVAGGNGIGYAANQLSSPSDISVDKDGAVYIADFNNDRVQKWNSNAVAGSTVAGGHVNGYAANQVNPSSVFVDKDYTVYVGDYYAHRVQKWVKGAAEGVVVAGGHFSGSAANQVISPTGIFVDSIGNVYVSDVDNHRVQKWAPGAVEGITVAGGNGAGGAANQLNGPRGITVDDSGYVYVADYYNNRVQKWAPGATSGETFAGAGVLFNPTSLCFDAQKTLYIAEFGKQRVVKWLKGATSGITVGGTIPISALYGLAVDKKGNNVYVCDAQNNYVFKISQLSRVDSNYIPTSNGNYYALVTDNNGCTAKTNTIAVQQSGLPSISIAATTNAVCPNTTVSFKAKANNIGADYSFQWYKNNVAIDNAQDSILNIDSLTVIDSVYCKVVVNPRCNNPLVATSKKLTPNLIKSRTINITKSGCYTVFYNGKSYTNDTIMIDTLRAKGGCDSIINKVSLHVFKASYSTTNASICLGSSYLFNGTSYNQSGTYTAHLSNSRGCDSSATLILSIVPTVTPTLEIAANSTTILANESVTFTANTQNISDMPTYQWIKNSVPIVGANASSFNTDQLKNNDTISCLVTTNQSCATANNLLSNKLIINVNIWISGTVKNPNGIIIPSVSLLLNGKNTATLDAKGTFNLNVSANNNYTITAFKNDDKLVSNGVNGTDISLIQSHILKKVLLNSPFKLIAGDVNSDGSVNGTDIALIKSLILKRLTKFNGNRLWTFVDSSYAFPVPTKPFPYRDSITLIGQKANTNINSFIGVKLGDVNYDWNAAVLGNGVNNNSPIELYNDDIIVNQLENEVRIPIRIKNFNQIMGIQFTLNFNKNAFALKAIENNKIGADYNLDFIEDGKIPFLWVDATCEPKTLADSTLLFELVFNKKGDFNTEEIKLSDDITSINAFDGNYKTVGVFKTKGVITEKSMLNDAMTIYPNPAKDKLMIKGQHINKIEVIDNSGRIIKSMQVKDATNPSLMVSKLGKGVYHLSVQTINGKTNLITFIKE